ncbi:MAG: hypothetical protein AAFR66_16980 [Bacteroidota bacterium]
MKLRTLTNSIRIRLRKSELGTLQEKKLVEEKVSFPAGPAFSYALSISPNIDQVQATYENHQMRISLPDAVAQQWISTNEVGINADIPLDNGEALNILIEKDFPCNDREDEDKSDTFWELVSEDPKAC